MKRRRRKTQILIFIVILATGIALAGFFTWKRVSALVVTRYVAKQLKLPLTIESALWEVDLSELFQCRVRTLHLNLLLEPSDLRLEIDTPVSCYRDQSSLHIHLEPILKIGRLPKMKGTIEISATLEPLSSSLSLPRFKTANSVVMMKSLEPFEASTSSDGAKFKVSDYEFKLVVSLQKKIQAIFNGLLSNITVETENAFYAANKLEIENQSILNDQKLSKSSPVLSKTDLTIHGFQFMNNTLLLEEKKIPIHVKSLFDGKDFQDFKVSIFHPFRLTVEGSYVDKNLKSTVAFNGNLKELYEKRFVKWFGNSLVIFKNSKSKGTIKLSSSLNVSPRSGLSAKGRLHLNAKDFLLPTKNVSIRSLKLVQPFEFSSLNKAPWGELTIKNAKYKNLNLDPIWLRTRVNQKQLEITTLASDSTDNPYAQSIFGNKVVISDLYFKSVFAEKMPEINFSFKGGPFKITQIQKALCKFKDKPIEGNLEFKYSKISKTKDGFVLNGKTLLTAFGGTIHTGNVSFHPKSSSSDKNKLSFSVEVDRLNLQKLGTWLNFGVMRGVLSAGLNDATYGWSKVGPIPYDYDFFIRLEPNKGERQIEFDGNSMIHTMELMGANPADIPFYASPLLTVVRLYRNISPTTIRYAGFRAKTFNTPNGKYTELSTFDPDKQYHYLLFGSGFKIPLNSGGIYPVRMEMAAFHSWVYGMAQYIKQRFKKNDSPEKPKKPEQEKQEEKSESKNNKKNANTQKLQKPTRSKPKKEEPASEPTKPIQPKNPNECIPIF